MGGRLSPHQETIHENRIESEEFFAGFDGAGECGMFGRRSVSSKHTRKYGTAASPYQTAILNRAGQQYHSAGLYPCMHDLGTFHAWLWDIVSSRSQRRVSSSPGATPQMKKATTAFGPGSHEGVQTEYLSKFRVPTRTSGSTEAMTTTVGNNEPHAVYPLPEELESDACPLGLFITVLPESRQGRCHRASLSTSTSRWYLELPETLFDEKLGSVDFYDGLSTVTKYPVTIRAGGIERPVYVRKIPDGFPPVVGRS
eukprot:Polyplicarium_translucidae@DN5416_c0_g1_i1.p1